MKAIFDGNAMLKWGEESGKVRRVVTGNKGTSDSAPCSANANGAEFVCIIRTFMECKEEL
jgi:hypothetical protein